jgi:hypothetical protein
MPKSWGKNFRYRIFKDGEVVRDVTFYQETQADADSCARAWIKKHPGETIKRIKPRS